MVHHEYHGTPLYNDTMVHCEGLLTSPHQNQSMIICHIASYGNIVRSKQLINCHGTSLILGTDYTGMIQGC